MLAAEPMRLRVYEVTGRNVTDQRKIAVIFPALLGGGAEAVCLWMLDVLREDYEVTFVTLVAPNWEDLDDFYGTSLAQDPPRVLCPHGQGLNRMLWSGYAPVTLRQHVLGRFYRKRGGSFDLGISAFGELDMGRRGIQYVHYPLFGRGASDVRTQGGFPDSRVRRIYREGCARVYGSSYVRMGLNRTLANSEWTARHVRTAYGTDAGVLYPPVVTDYPEVSWNERENNVLCIARMHPEKNLERAVRVVQKVRDQGQALSLHLVCGGKADPAYETRIRRLVADRDDWLHLHRDLSRRALGQLLAKSRYAFHPRENEHFGIAIAEAMCAGCVPFLPSSGGQTEIVEGNSALCYEAEDDAVAKLAAVAASEERQAVLRETLRPLRERFGIDRFREGILAVCSEEVDRL